MKNDKLLAKFLWWLFVLGVILFTFWHYCNADDMYLVAKFSHKWGVDERVVREIVLAESSGDRTKESPAGAIGYMGVMPETLREYFEMRYKETGDRKYLVYSKAPIAFYKAYLKVREYNINVGCWELRRCLDKTISKREPKGNYLKALNYYIMGKNQKTKVAWEYIYKIVNSICNFKS